MATFSIKDIEAVSGIRCHTLRIWEQRYGIVLPKRTDSNIRYYTDDDLKLILNISILNKHGYKISEIAKMDKEEINNLILGITDRKNIYTAQINALISCMIAFDEPGFHNILTTSIIQNGLEHTMIHIVFPFLNEAGIMWQVGSIHPSHEHFASQIIKQKLYLAIDGNMMKYAENRKRFLLFLPEKEQHSLGLLFANYILRSRGHEVLFLGQELPMKEFRTAIQGYEPDYVFSIATTCHLNLNKQEFVNEIASIWKNTHVLLSGIQFLKNDIEFPQNVSVIRKMDDFLTFANNLCASGYNRN
jgi:DNA-binding transcriptional MerR regulator